MLTRSAFMFIALMVLGLFALVGCASSSESGSRAAASNGVGGAARHGDAVALGSANRQDDDDGEADDDDDDDDDEEEEIPLSNVPEAVMKAASAAVQGIVFEEAERELEDGQTVYCLEGEADGVEYEVEVTADGEVLEVETDDADDDDDDDDDDDEQNDDDDA
jgi:uncharacterized membrane protein YkoI